MDRPWWASILIILIGLFSFGLSVLVYGWIERARTKRTADDAQLPYPLSIRLFVSLFALLMLFLFGASVASPDFRARVFDVNAIPRLAFVAILATPFVTCCAWFLLDCWIARFELVSEGVRFRSPFGRHGMICWRDVTNVYHADAFAFWYRIRADKQTVRISTYRRGLYLLAREIIANVKPNAMGERTREDLEATAAGTPPPIA